MVRSRLYETSSGPKGTPNPVDSATERIAK